MAAYREKAQYYTLFDQLTASNPDLMSSQVIGHTVNGFTLKVYKIGNPNGGKVLIDGCIHGKSWAASELLWIYVNWLLGGSPEATRILQRNYTLIVPCINVDVIWYGRPNANRVDLNRNFETNWELGNPDPTAYDYRGPSPLSEPETQAMRNLFERERPAIYLNHHTWGGDWWGGYGTPEQAAFNNSVNNLHQQIAQQRGVTPYPYHPDGLAAGFAASDAAVFGGSNSFAIEVFVSGETDVYSPPPLSEIQTYWFNRVLAVYIAISQAVEGVSPPPIVCQDYTIQAECEAAGCYWYDGSCHSEPLPTISPLLPVLRGLVEPYFPSVFQQVDRIRLKWGFERKQKA